MRPWFSPLFPSAIGITRYSLTEGLPPGTHRQGACQRPVRFRCGVHRGLADAHRVAAPSVFLSIPAFASSSTTGHTVTLAGPCAAFHHPRTTLATHVVGPNSVRAPARSRVLPVGGRFGSLRVAGRRAATFGWAGVWLWPDGSLPGAVRGRAAHGAYRLFVFHAQGGERWTRGKTGLGCGPLKRGGHTLQSVAAGSKPWRARVPTLGVVMIFLSWRPREPLCVAHRGAGAPCPIAAPCRRSGSGRGDARCSPHSANGQSGRRGDAAVPEFAWP